MPSKLNARVSFKHGTQADWEKAENFIPYDRELIVYDCDETHDYERIKLGDGVYNPQTGKVEGTNINDLPFLTFGFKTSKEGNYQFGTKADNLEATSEHSVIAGRDIKAGVRGLKILGTTVNHDANNKPESLTIATVENAQDFYNEEAGFVPGETRAALILAHHSFETFKVMTIANNVISLSPIVEGGMMPDNYYALHEDNETRNYLWLYNVEERYDMPYFNIDVNKNCPVRPEADFTYGLGDNINIVGRSSFSSGMGNQNMGWYSATMGRFNIAYYAGFALGAYNKALGTYSVALNQKTEATATGATSKGYLTKATANYAEAGGQQTEANHKASFTHGLGTKSGRQHQAIVGEYNEESKTALFVVGNGSGGQKASASETISYEISKTHTLSHKNIIPGTVVATDRVYTFDDKEHKSESFKIDYENGTITTDENFPAYMGTLPLTTTYEYYLGDNGVVRSNAFEVEKDGSATIGKTGTKENSVATKGYVDAAKVETENNVEKAIDAANKSYFVENYAQIEKCEPHKAHNDITIKDNVITCTSNAIDVRNQYRAQVSNIYADKYQGLNYELKFKIDEFKADITHDGLWFKFVDFSGNNIPNGAEGLGLVVRSTNCLFGYITEDSFNYDNTSLGVKTFNIPLNTTDEFKLNARLENNKIIIKFTNLATNREYGEYEYPLTETCTITPSLAIGCRFVKAKVEYNIYSDEYVSLARKSDVNQALANAKSYTDDKINNIQIPEQEKEVIDNYKKQVVIQGFDLTATESVYYTASIQNPTTASTLKIKPNFDVIDITGDLIHNVIYESDGFSAYASGGGQTFEVISGKYSKEQGIIKITSTPMRISKLTINYRTRTKDLGHKNIVPGTIEIMPSADAPVYDTGDGYLFEDDKPWKNACSINYETGILNNIPDWNIKDDCQVVFWEYNYNDTNALSTNALNAYVEEKDQDKFEHITNYMLNNNDYIYLETKSAYAGLYGESWYRSGKPESAYDYESQFQLTPNGFKNAAFNEATNRGGAGANPYNDTDKYIIFSNNYTKAYEDFLIKIDLNILDSYASSTTVGSATGPIIHLFDKSMPIQLRVNGSIVTGLGGTTQVISGANLGSIGQHVIYFKYIKALGLLNIYKSNLDNLIASIQLTETEMATLKPQLAFGGRCCTYSAECEIHKAELELKPIKKADYELILNKDPYKYYMIEE